MLAALILSSSCGIITEDEQHKEARQVSESHPRPPVGLPPAYLREDTSAGNAPLSSGKAGAARTHLSKTPDRDGLDDGFERIPKPDFSDWGADLEDVSRAGMDEIAHSRLLSSVSVPVISPERAGEVDSLTVALEKRLSVRPDRLPASVVLERWHSPVNYRGYKFNRRKLILFGAEPHLPVRVYRLTDKYYFSVARRLYVLEAGPEFSSFIAVRDTALSRYLLHLAD